jgi:hypothetical protein
MEFGASNGFYSCRPLEKIIDLQAMRLCLPDKIGPVIMEALSPHRTLFRAVCLFILYSKDMQHRDSSHMGLFGGGRPGDTSEDVTKND